MVASSILITGANRGLGLELVRQLASLTDVLRPKLIIAACRNPDAAAADLKALSQKFTDAPKISLIQLDVTDENSIQSAFVEASSLCGAAGLNLLINNAGVFPVKHTPEQFSFQSMTDCMKGNAVAPMILSKTFHPLLKTAAARWRGEHFQSRHRHDEFQFGFHRQYADGQKLPLLRLQRLQGRVEYGHEVPVLRVCPG